MKKEDILNLGIKSNPNLLPCEKETTCIINDGGLIVHSDHRTGIRWCVKQLRENRAELRHYDIDGNSLCSIGIKTDINLISFKSKPRKGDNISNCFTI